jgi:hypothetical protein
MSDFLNKAADALGDATDKVKDSGLLDTVEDIVEDSCLEAGALRLAGVVGLLSSGAFGSERSGDTARPTAHPRAGRANTAAALTFLLGAAAALIGLVSLLAVVSEPCGID